MHTHTAKSRIRRFAARTDRLVTCATCSKVATMELLVDTYGVTVARRYCEKCIAKAKLE